MLKRRQNDSDFAEKQKEYTKNAKRSDQALAREAIRRKSRREYYRELYKTNVAKHKKLLDEIYKY